MVKLDSIIKDFNKKPQEKKEDPKTITTISGSANGETKVIIPKSDLFPTKTSVPSSPASEQTPAKKGFDFGSVPKAGSVIAASPQTPPVQEPEKKPFILPPVGEQKKPLSKNPEDLDYSPELPENKHAIMIYGLKGSGKTSLAFSFPGTHMCISFDKKSTSIKENLSEEDKKRITVYDGIRYYDRSSPEMWLISSDLSWKYIQGLIKKVKDRPDWVVVDGGEVFETMAEMVMRYNNQLQPFQGITNRNVWKERRMYLEQFFNMCFELSKKGIIWTSYLDQHTIYDAGSIVVSHDIPRWVDVVEQRTDSVIRVERATDKTRQTFYATAETSKWKSIPSSPKIDVTNGGIQKLTKGDL